MLNRREFLAAGMMAGASLLVGSKTKAETLQLQKFIDPLPIPEVLRPAGRLEGAPYYEIRMTQFRKRLHGELPRTSLWGYNGTYPGPTLEVNRNEPVWVRWINDLPQTHLLSVDTSLHGAHPENPIVRNVVHLHGAKVPDWSDGYPEAWFTPGESDLYYYPNHQRATTLWYHDHAIGITRLNVYAGLAGFYLIRELTEQKLNLPKGPYEIPLMIQDRSFHQDGRLLYAHHWMPMFFGRMAMVNGAVWPYLEVEPRKYRFRILNGSNGRSFHLKLFRYNESTGSAILSESGPSFYQIGTDGGLLSAPVQLNDPQDPFAARLLISPSERADIVIDFAAFAGKSLVLHNDAKSPFRGLDSALRDEAPLSKIMLFRVKSRAVSDPSSLPMRLQKVKPIDPKSAVLHRHLTLDYVFDSHGGIAQLLLNNTAWSATPTETPRLGTTEVWNILNLTGEVHPIHLHLIQFQVLNSQGLDIHAFREKKSLIYTGPAVPPAAGDTGWKDTVRANPGQVTRIIARFGGYSGLYTWHCHILEHEDNDMMRPIKVLES